MLVEKLIWHMKQEVARRLLALDLRDEAIDELTGETLDLRAWVEDVV